MGYIKQVSFERLPFKFNPSEETKNFIMEIKKILGYPIPFYIENSTNNYGYANLFISSGLDKSKHLSIYCHIFEEISEGHLLHELLHIFRIANQIPTWNPLGNELSNQKYIPLDNLIEHNWIYKQYEYFSINFDPYKDLIDRNRKSIKFADVEKEISNIKSLNRKTMGFKYRILKISLIALELVHNCPNNSLSRKLKKKLNLAELPIILQTITTLDKFLSSYGIETKETKLGFIKLMVDSLNFSDKYKKYMVYQSNWIFYDWD